jgi:hypothetical protein
MGPPAIDAIDPERHCDNPDAVSRKAAPMWVHPGFAPPELADDQMCA